MASRDYVDQDTGEILDDGLPAGVRISKISIGYGGKLNLGDYSSAALDCHLWADVDLSEVQATPTETLAALRQIAVTEIREQAGMLSARSARMALAQVAQRYTGSALPARHVIQDADGNLHAYSLAQSMDAETAAAHLADGQDPAIVLASTVEDQTELDVDRRAAALYQPLGVRPDLAPLALDMIRYGINSIFETDVRVELDTALGELDAVLNSGTTYGDGPDLADYMAAEARDQETETAETEHGMSMEASVEDY